MQATLSLLRKTVVRVDEPQSYYEGRGPRLAGLPQNVVMFHRERMAPGHERDNQHHRFMLIVNLRTSGRLCLDERVIPVPAEHALLVFPYQLHHYLTIDVPISWLFVTFEMDSSALPSGLRNQAIPICPVLVSSLMDVVQAYLEPRSTPPLRLGPGVAYLASIMADRLPDTAAPARDAQDAQRQPHERNIVERVNRYIYPRLSEPLTIGEVAAAVNLSASHLRTRFCAVMGDSLGRYIRRVKINRAMSLLRDSEQSVSTIAEACGFASIFSFSRSFRRVVGCSPKQFREGNHRALGAI